MHVSTYVVHITRDEDMLAASPVPRRTFLTLTGATGPELIVEDASRIVIIAARDQTSNED